MKDKQVGVVHLEPCEARLNLGSHRLVQLVDLVDHEHARAGAFERLPHDLLAVPHFVAGSGINEVEASVEGPLDRRDEWLQRQLAVGQVTDPKDRGHKTGTP